MMYDVAMPSLGADMEKGKLMKWKIAPGDEIKKGDIIALVETTKSTVEIESFRSGRVLDLVGKEGEEVDVGEIIAHLDIKDEAIPKTKRIKVSPAAKEYARKYHIEINNIKGSGSEGEINLGDVEKIRSPKDEVNDEDLKKRETQDSMREVIGRAMSHSKKEIPHYYLKLKVPLIDLFNWLDIKNANISAGKRLMAQAVFLKVVACALVEHPELNGYFKNGTFFPEDSINISMAIALKRGGVIAPALVNVEKMDLVKLNEALLDLIFRTKKGEVKNSEMTKGTITVTNIGSLGCDEVYGVIFPPQVSLIGFGRIHEEAIVRNGKIITAPVVNITLSADHRVSDGMSGARFLAKVEQLLKAPHFLETDNE